MLTQSWPWPKSYWCWGYKIQKLILPSRNLKSICGERFLYRHKYKRTTSNGQGRLWSLSGPVWSHLHHPCPPLSLGLPCHRTSSNSAESYRKASFMHQQCGNLEVKFFLSTWSFYLLVLISTCPITWDCFSFLSL